MKYITLFFISLASILNAAAQSPIAAFTVNDSLGCAPLAVQFQNNSSYATSWQWDFGNGNTSSLEHPSNVYSTPGTYNVRLIAISGSQRDTIVKSGLITVVAEPLAQFTVSAISSCTNGDSIQFINSSLHASNWIWDFGDGNSSTQFSPSHRYNSPGKYAVKLIASNNHGCSDLFLYPDSITILPLPLVDFTADTSASCDSLHLFQFNSPANAISSFWEFGDGNNSILADPLHSYNGSGNYDVSLTIADANGCIGSLMKPDYIKIFPAFEPVIGTYNVNGCVILPAYLYNYTPGSASHFWDYGNGNTSASSYPLQQYYDPGAYTVSLTVTDTNGCTYTTIRDSAVIAHPKPQAAFSASTTTGCAPLQVDFIDATIGAVNLEWEFGDDSISLLPNPSHVYQEPGTYIVKLNAYSDNGCKTITSDTVTVHQPIADFTAVNRAGCGPLSVSFTEQAGGNVDWIWDYGDGTAIQSGQNPVHVYQEYGEYDVQLMVTDSFGCKDSTTKPAFITVHPDTLGYFIPDTMIACHSITADFDAAPLAYHSWDWNFGDGNSSTQAKPQHSYAAPGTYVVSLATQTAYGCPVSIDTFSVFILQNAVADFDFEIDCQDFTVQFSDSSVGAISWLWGFGDAAAGSGQDTSTMQNPDYQYPGDGFYTVSLNITDSSGCSSAKVWSNAISFSSCPDSSGSQSGGGGANDSTAALQPPQIQGCVPLTVSFYNPYPDTLSFFWDFGDGNNSTSRFPTHTYQSGGVFDVVLIAEQNNGALDTITWPSLIAVSTVNANFTMQQFNACQNRVIEFTDLSSNAISWQWNFGDGTDTMIQNPSHTFSLDGKNYQIGLEVKDSLGCSSVHGKNVVAKKPAVSFEYSTAVCFYDTVHFSSNLDYYQSYSWDFGDGNQSALQSPRHVYDSAGSYLVTLTVADTLGCTHSYVIPNPVTVNRPLADFTISGDSASCNSLTVDFMNQSDAASDYYWDFGDSTGSAVKNPNHLYTAPGDYTITLIASDAMACVDTVVKKDFIQVFSAEGDFTFTQDQFCLPITASFSGQGTDAVEWIWDFGNGDSAFVQNPVNLFYGAPEDDIRLTLTDSNGCMASIIKPNIEVFTFNITANSSTGCVPFDVQFSSGADSISSFIWDFGNGVTSTMPSPVHVYQDSGYYSVSLIAQAADGCLDTLMVDSMIYASQLEASFTAPDTAGCAPSFVSFSNTSVNSGSWLWDFGDNTFSNQQHPSHVYSSPGNYNVQLIASNSTGCSDTLVMSNAVKVLGPEAVFTASVNSGCAPLEIEFTDQSLGAISSVWYFGDGDTSHSSHPVHTYSGSGNFQVALVTEDTSGCVATYSLMDTIKVFSLPTASFIPEDTVACEPGEITFVNTSASSSTFIWNFGDSLGSNLENPVHIYAEPGNYPVSLFALNEHGCSDTAFFEGIEILPRPEASFELNEVSGCPPLSITPENTSSHLQGATFSWTLGEEMTSPDSLSLFEIDSSGSYDISLLVQNSNGCSDSVIMEGAITVYSAEPPDPVQIITVSVLNYHSLEITWNGDNIDDSGYLVIYRSERLTETFTPVDTIYDMNISRYVDDQVNTDEYSWCYKIVPVSYCGIFNHPEDAESACSIHLQAQLAGKHILISWTPFVGCGFDSYQLRRKKQGEAEDKVIANLSSDRKFYMDTSFFCPEEVQYSISTSSLCNSEWNAFSNKVSLIAPDISSGQQVEVIRSTVVNNEAILTEWSQPAVFPEMVERFDVYRSEDRESYQLVHVLPGNSDEFLDEQVEVNERQYFYKIIAHNGCSLKGMESNTGSSILLKAETVSRMTKLEWTPYVEWKEGVDHYLIEKMDEYGEWKVIGKVSGDKVIFMDE